MGSRGCAGSGSRWVAAGSRWEEVSVGMLTVPCCEQGELEGNRHPEAVRKKKVEEEGREKRFFFFCLGYRKGKACDAQRAAGYGVQVSTQRLVQALR